MQSRNLILILLFALILAAGVILLPSIGDGVPSEPSDPGRQEEELTEQAPAQVRADPVPLKVAGPTSRTDGETRIEVPEEDTAPRAGVVNPHAEGPGAVLVRLIDKESQQPVPGADLYVIDMTKQDPERLERALQSGQSDLTGLLAQHGLRYRSNEEGIVRIPPVKEQPLLLARTEESFALRWNLELGQSEWLIELEKELIVRVRVVDRDGVPQAEVPVALRMIHERYTYDINSIKTAQDGVAVVRGINAYLDSLDQTGGELMVGLGMILDSESSQDPDCQQTLDEDLLSRGETELILPPTGSVRIRLLDQEDEPFLDEAFGMLQEQETGNSRTLGRNTNYHQADQGFIDIPHVGLGLDLKCTVRFGNASFGEDLDFSGPTLAGEQVEIEMRRVVRPILVGRVLDAQGEIMAETTLFTSLEHKRTNGTSSTGSSLKTDAVGRFRYELENADPPEGNTSRTLMVRHDSEDGVRHEGQIDLSASQEIGVTDVGDVQLIAPPLLAAGLVLGSDGKPLPHASVRLEKEHFYGQDPPRSYWNTTSNGYGSCNEEGVFSIQGASESGNFRLTVDGNGHSQKQVPIQVGQTGLEIRLEASAVLTGRVLTDPEITPSHVQVRLREGNSTRTVGLQGEQGEFTFRLETSPLNNATLLVTTSMGESLLEVEGLNLYPGQEFAPPAANPIDLRGSLNLFQLLVQDSQGKALNAQVVLDSSNGRNQYNERGGDFQFAVLATSLTAEVTAQGHRPQTVDLIQAQTVVTLQDGIPIRLRLAQSISLPENGLLGVRLVRDVGEARFISGNRQGQERSTFDASGNLDLKLGGPGKYRVQLRGTIEVDRRSSSTSTQSGQILQVEDQSGLQVFNLEVDQLKVDDLFKRLQSR